MDLGIDWIESAIRLIVAAALGGLIGIERELDGQDAGFRTHLLLSLGAAVFGVVSIGAFADFTAQQADTNVVVDITRIASYVAAGVGFIGGGAIIKHGGIVKGITTASSLWVAAAIGLAAGLGHWPSAVIACGAAIFALAVLRPVSTALSERQRRKEASLWIDTTPDARIDQLIQEVVDHGIAIRSVEMGLEPAPSGGRQLQISTWPGGGGATDELLSAISARSDVTMVTTGAAPRQS
jgi:putative Mg2+ transporter-C (MgtC) family protein